MNLRSMVRGYKASGPLTSDLTKARHRHFPLSPEPPASSLCICCQRHLDVSDPPPHGPAVPPTVLCRHPVVVFRGASAIHTFKEETTERIQG